MSLLTEKQIQDLYLHLDNVSTTTKMKEVIQNWNEKQPAQFEPDWSKAPECAVIAVAHLAWVTKIGNWLVGYEIAKFERPEPTITPHPHAELMLKYAEVAARRVDPWVEFQVYKTFFSQWVTLETPTFFDTNQQYRYIGDNK